MIKHELLKEKAESLKKKALPVALPVMGVLLVVGFGIKAFKKITNKA